MASRTSDLIVRAKSQGTQQVAKDVESIGSSAKKAGSELSGAFKGLAGLAVVGAIGAAVKSASDLEQAMGGVDRIFKGSAGEIHKWAKDSTDSFRVPAAEAEKFAATMGNALQKGGLSAAEAAVKTKELAQVGADLSSAFGGSTVAAVEAVSGAITKGEWERLESIGVNVKAADVAMEAAALSAGSMAGASAKAIDTQARINVLMREAAPAFGAAADESETYQAKLDGFNEVLANVSAEVGGALLPVLGDLLSQFAGLASGLAPILSVGAEFLGWLLELPVAVQAVAAGFALWHFTDIGNTIGDIGRKMKETGVSAKGLGSALGSIAGSVIGGGALAGFALILGDITSTFAEASRLGQDFQNRVTDLADQLILVGDSGSEAFKELLRAQIESSDAFQALIASGHDYGAAMDFFTDSTKNGEAANQAMLQSLVDTNPELAVNAGHMTQLGQRAEELAAQKQAYTAEEQRAAAATGESTAAMEQQIDPAVALADALKQAKAAAEATAAQGFLNQIKQASDEAKTALDLFAASIDAVDGRLSNEDAVVAWTRGMQDLGVAFTEAAAKGGVSTEALVAWDVVALQATEGSRQVYDALTQQASAYPGLVAGAFSAAGGSANLAYATQAAMSAATGARDAFIATASQFGLTSGQAAALANTLGILDATQLDSKVFEVIAQDAQAAAAVAALQAQGIDAKSFEVTAVTDPATGAVEQVLTYTDASGAIIEVGAETATAQGDISKVAGANYPATVKTTADTSAANQAITSFTAQQRNTTVQVNANTAPAVASVSTLISNTSARSAMITVNANTGPAQSAINAVAHGNYSATIQVSANTGAAQSAIAAIPRTVTVTPVPPPAPAAAAMSMSSGDFAAPSPPQIVPAPHGPLRLSSTGSPSQDFGTVGHTTVYVNVTGAIDPDQTARTIQRVLDRRERRAYGVTARGTGGWVSSI